MLYNPRNLIKKDGAFVFGGTVKAVAHEALCQAVFCEFWQGFSFRLSTLALEESDALLFRIGDAEPLPTDGYDYTVNVTKSGVCLAAKSARDLIHAYMALIDRIEATDGEGYDALRIGACEIREKALISCRMAHFCIFPETSLFCLVLLILQ